MLPLSKEIYCETAVAAEQIKIAISKQNYYLFGLLYYASFDNLNSPDMLPFKSLLHVDRSARTPIYLQITNQIVRLIQQGQLGASSKIPSSRSLADLLSLNRNTVIKSYEELEALGWISIQARRGVFVVDNLPTVVPHDWSKEVPLSSTATSSFSFYDFPHLLLPPPHGGQLGFDDGLPDARLAPIEELARGYAKNLRQLAFENDLYYQNGLGHLILREQLVQYLNETKGLNIHLDQIMITRGTIMSIHLAIASTIRKGDWAIVGENSYPTANRLIQHFGGQLATIPVDEYGFVVEAIPALCKKYPVRALYITSHHYHPTTVTLIPERRLRLMQLAEKYQFMILEDDYDYDYHFDNAPVLPLASGDKYGSVLYFGSYTKLIAPAFRVGYLVGPKRLIQALPKLRRMMDRQGDMVLEKTIADLLVEGTIRRHLKKSWRHYKERRDVCCQLLEEQLGRYISFEKPAGGLALWTTFSEKIDLLLLSKTMKEKGILLEDGTRYLSNRIRMGFASMTIVELEQCIKILKQQIEEQVGV